MKNVWILTLAQALAGCGTIMLVAFGGIAGARLAPNPALATLPLSLSVLGVALTAIPASLLMRRIGRKPAFVGSALIAAVAALICAQSLASQNFVLLCVAAVLLGCNMAFVQQYRFAATEYLPADQAGTAVARVMLGTLAAALLGPGIGALFKDAMGWPEFTGSFVALAVIALAAAGVLLQLTPAPEMPTAADGPARPLRQIAAQPDYRLAVFAGVVSYAVMSFIMTATPISMHVHDGYTSGQTTAVITAHLLGMYLPSLATPWIVTRLGLRAMLLWGSAAMALCIAISALLEHAFAHYFWGLVLLGLGWNLMFVAATTLLTTTYRNAERFAAQGLNDFTIFGAQAIASLLAGSAIATIGWEWVNLVSLPLVALVFAAALLRRRRQAAP